MAFPANLNFGVLRPTIAAAGTSTDVSFDGTTPASKVTIFNTSGVAVRLFSDAAAMAAGTTYVTIPSAGTLQIWAPLRFLHLLSTSGDAVIELLVER